MERRFSAFEMHHGDDPYEADEPITDVHFPVTGAASIIAQDPDGRSVDVAVVGTEGWVRLPVFLGTDQIGGSCSSSARPRRDRPAARDGAERQLVIAGDEPMWTAATGRRG
jgi:hypothetical protein